MSLNALLAFITSLTILLPAFVGLVRFHRIDKSYQPFIIYLLVGLATEIVGFIWINTFHSNTAVLYNFFIVAEWLLIMWQFYSWGFFSRHKTWFYLLVTAVLLIWIWEHIVSNKLQFYNPYFRVIASFLIILISINIINYTITHDYKNIFLNARFLICIGLIIFFLYKILYEWAYQVSSIKGHDTFSNLIISGFSKVNAFVNVFFILPVLLIPKRDSFVEKPVL